MKIYIYFIVIVFSLLSIFGFGCKNNSTEPEPHLNRKYLRQEPPGLTPAIFAPDIISTGRDWAITFSPDGKECFFTRSLNRPTIMTLKEETSGWTTPKVASFSGTYLDIEPHIVPNGDILYFGSEGPLPNSESEGLHQWMMEKTDSGWSEPRPMDPPLRDIFMMYPSAANNGNMYFTASDGSDQWIAISKYENGKYQEPERLSENINSLQYTAHPFISPDESYLIFDAVTGIQNNQYICDLYISFRNPDGSWNKSVNMGNPINSDKHECCAFVSRDNAYLFFFRESNIYWVDAQLIENLTPARLK